MGGLCASISTRASNTRISQCYVRLPFTDLGNRQWRLQDQLNTTAYDRDGNDLQSRGVYRIEVH